MNGLSSDEILRERKRIISSLEERDLSFDIEVIDSLLTNCELGPIACLGKSIELMQDADLIVFAPGWYQARGCRIEHEVAAAYGKECLEV